MEAKLNKSELRILERFIIKRLDEIIFNERKRPSGVQKVSGYRYENGKRIAIRQGGLNIEDRTGKGGGALKKSIQRNKNFISQDKNGLQIDVKGLPDYFKYLDDERKTEDYNWYLTEAIFEDEQISKKIKEVLGTAYKRAIINLMREKTKD